jgi:putative glutamine amidotransferase
VPTSPPSDADRGQSRPIIGVATGELVASYGVWKEKAALVPADYLGAVERAGGIPIVLAPIDGAADQLTERIDGLVLTGGADVDSALYGEERHSKAQRPDQARDRFEIELLEAATARDMPVLAVCRGIQIVNVWRGGTLHQHLPEVTGHKEHMAVPGTYGVHPLRIDPDSRLGAIIGRSETEVPGHHHQAPDRVGDGLVASAWADDGIVEGLEDPTLGFFVAVQWHPEMGDDPTLFEALVAAARHAEVLGAS